MGTLGASFDSGVDIGIEGDEEPIRLILIKDFDPLGIVWVIKEMDIFSDEFHRGFINFSVQRDGSVSVHFPSGPGAEKVGEILGSGPQEVKVLGVTIPRGFLGGAMDGSMVGLITPLLKPFIQVGQRQGRRKKGEKLHS